MPTATLAGAWQAPFMSLTRIHCRRTGTRCPLSSHAGGRCQRSPTQGTLSIPNTTATRAQTSTPVPIVVMNDKGHYTDAVTSTRRSSLRSWLVPSTVEFVASNHRYKFPAGLEDWTACHALQSRSVVHETATSSPRCAMIIDELAGCAYMGWASSARCTLLGCRVEMSGGAIVEYNAPSLSDLSLLTLVVVYTLPTSSAPSVPPLHVLLNGLIANGLDRIPPGFSLLGKPYRPASFPNPTATPSKAVPRKRSVVDTHSARVMKDSRLSGVSVTPYLPSLSPSAIAAPDVVDASSGGRLNALLVRGSALRRIRMQDCITEPGSGRAPRLLGLA
ncbi:hypothetical protein R3P38DRAFT_3201489 [Favolaschia claudopus]|uniref:Uncharacterized protein n=1 Tax=Favolaschia claudopus TaxID=2862362 RepID=A0AAW0AZ66_9AGAR